MSGPPPLGRRDDRHSRWVCFELAGQCYGLEILSVQEVLTDADIEPVPGAPAAVLGVANLRGSIVTIVDLRLRMGLPATAAPLPMCIMVVDGPGEAIGLRVDKVVDVRSIPLAAIRPLPRTGNELVPELLGVYSRDDRMLTLLAAAPLLACLQPSAE